MLGNPLILLYRIPALLVAITVHEYAHGRVSEAFGDPTPRWSGRLSLNPIRHLDMLGSLMILLVGFGWAKPVPVNPNYYKNPRRDMALVGLAGPITNFVTAIILGRLGFFFLTGPLGSSDLAPILGDFLIWIVLINIALGLFNLVPIPPLDGSKVLAYFVPDRLLPAYWQLEKYGILILLLVLFVSGNILWQILTPLMRFVLGVAGLGGQF